MRTRSSLNVQALQAKRAGNGWTSVGMLYLSAEGRTEIQTCANT